MKARSCWVSSLKLSPSCLPLLLLCANLVSCLEPPDYAKEDGAKVGVEVLRNKLLDAWGGDVNLNQMAVGESNAQEKTVKIATSIPQTVLLKTTRVAKIKESESDPSIVEFTITSITKEDPDNETPEPSSREFTFSARKQKTLTAESLREIHLENQQENLLQNLNQALQKKQVPISTLDQETDAQVTSLHMMAALWNMCNPPSASMVQLGLLAIECFNLKVTPILSAVPDLVRRDDPACEGLPDCQMKVTQIEFDIVYTVKEENSPVTSRTKVNYSVRFSSDVNFLSRILDFCYTGMASAQNQKFPVTICFKTTKFKFHD